MNFDFTNNLSDEIIAWFSGHVHRDEVEIIDNIPHITITNYFNTEGGGCDVVTIDRKNKKIYTKRYNNGALTDYNRIINLN